MLTSVTPATKPARSHRYAPPLLDPLIETAESGRDTVPVVQAITKALGFDSFLYGAATATAATHDSEGKSYVYTTLPKEWVARYDQLAYIESDPRLMLTWDSSFPLVWDQANVRGLSSKSDRFLDDAMRFGIASGVCFMFHGPYSSHVIVALNSSVAIVDDIREQAIARISMC